MGYAEKPSNYAFLLKLRQSKKASLKPCSLIKPSTELRAYQVIGCIHMLSLSRMVLGDSVGLGKCCSQSTYIQTSDGLKRLSDFLSPEMKPGEYYPLPDSTRLLSLEGVSAPSCLYYVGEHQGLKIKTQKGYELSGLSNHPILIATDTGWEYKRLNELKVGEYACINRKGIFSDRPVLINYHKESDQSKKYAVPEYLNEDLSELLGFYMSKGNCCREYVFTITQHYHEVHIRIRDLLKRLFGYEQNEGVLDYNTEIKVDSLEICRCFESLGVNMFGRSGDQVVPDAVFRSPKSVIRSFLRGYFEGNGFLEAQNMVECSSESETLINQIQQLLLLFGIVSSRRRKMVKVRNEKKPYWILSFCGRDVDIFRENIGFVSSGKQDVLNRITRVKRNTNKDCIPFGRSVIKNAVCDIIEYLRMPPEYKSFSIKGSGWKDIVGCGLKRQIEELIYSKSRGGKKLTYDLLHQFVNILEKHRLSEHVRVYPFIKEIEEKHLFFDRITEIAPVVDKFADFCVPEYHNFVGNGFINHNTVQMLSAYAYLLERDPTLKLLIATTKSAAEQWAEEFHKFTVGITVHVLTNVYGEIKGKKGYGPVEVLKAEGVPYRVLRGIEARQAQYQTVTANVLICNYNVIMDDYVFLIHNRMPNYIFTMDEVQSIKNHKTRTHFSAEKIAESAKRVYGLSATLIKNRLEEAYNIYNVVVPGLFGGRNKFLNEYTIRKKMAVYHKGQPGKRGNKRYFNKIVGYKNLERFREVIEPFFLIRRTREVADELPRLISKKLMLDLTPEQDKLYKLALSGELYKRLIKDKYFKFKAFMESNVSPTDKHLEILDKLREKYDESLTKEGMTKNKIAGLSYCQMVSNGPGWIGEPGESSKEMEFARLFEQELYKEKVIVFTRFKSGIPRLEKILDGLDDPQKHVKITGDCSSEERSVAKKAFQDPSSDTNIIFITGAGSAAINLQAARIILFYDTPWSYGDLYQTIGRAQRIGSIYEHICLIHMVNRGTIDEHVLKILESKKDLITNVMGDIAEGAIVFKDQDTLFADDESTIDALYSSVFG